MKRREFLKTLFAGLASTALPLGAYLGASSLSCLQTVYSPSIQEMVTKIVRDDLDRYRRDLVKAMFAEGPFIQKVGIVNLLTEPVASVTSIKYEDFWYDPKA